MTYSRHTQTVHIQYTDSTQTVHRQYTDSTQTVHSQYTPAGCLDGFLPAMDNDVVISHKHQLILASEVPLVTPHDLISYCVRTLICVGV